MLLFLQNMQQHTSWIYYFIIILFIYFIILLKESVTAA